MIYNDFPCYKHGNLISGSPTALSRIRNEIIEANPIAENWWHKFTNWWGHWWGHNKGHVLACAEVAGGMAAAALVGIFNPPAGFLIGGLLGYAQRHQADKCYGG